jgi:hypothetical protein
MPFINGTALSKTRHFSMQEIQYKSITVKLMEDYQEHKLYCARVTAQLIAVQCCYVLRMNSIIYDLEQNYISISVTLT